MVAIQIDLSTAIDWRDMYEAVLVCRAGAMERLMMALDLLKAANEHHVK